MGCAVYRLRLGTPKPDVFGIRGAACRRPISAPAPGFKGYPDRLPLPTPYYPSWLAGPYRGRLFLWDGQHLYALDLITRKATTYTKVNARVSRLLLVGSRIYIGQVDGWFKVLDMNTGAELFRANTGGRNFDIKVGPDVVIVQVERRLIVFPNP
jgi:hypothetical protein